MNTSTIPFGLAFMDRQGELFGEHLFSSGAKNYHGFMPSLIYLFSSQNRALEDIEAIFVATGPGSFTGLRVGLSMAKGLAHGLKVPILGVSSLEAMAGQMPYATFPICAMITSRKGEIFMAMFHWDHEKGLQRITGDNTMKLTDMPFVIEKSTLFIGNDFRNQGNKMKDLLGEKAFLAPPHLWNLKASSVGNTGLKRFLKDESDNIRDLVPRYLRPPDIRPNPFHSLSQEVI